jgi:hypothetical protein
MNNKFKYIGRSKLRQKPHQIIFINEIIRLISNYV